MRRGITRLCHFTPSRNLIHIASGETGILATKKLKETERSVFTPTDLERLDGHEGHISCSIEYPNIWYFDKARAKDILFKDWVVLLINPQYLWLPDTRFCPRNSASNHGSFVSDGEEAFLALFASSVIGAYGKIFTRLPDRLPCCLTDEQAEVLIPDQIVMADILAIVVATETQAKNEAARLRLVNVPNNRFKFVVAPDLFKKYILSKLIRSGKRPIEVPWPQRDEI
jgi:ssDNA thymidine ADP-ribosyltransferase DarT-like protein